VPEASLKKHSKRAGLCRLPVSCIAEIVNLKTKSLDEVEPRTRRRSRKLVLCNDRKEFRMTKLIVASVIFTVISSITSSASADQLSIDAPLLDQTSVRVNEQIFTQQKNGVLSDSQAARLQVRRQAIMQEAANRRSRNRGILPTGDCSRLVSQMLRLKNIVSRTQ